MRPILTAAALIAAALVGCRAPQPKPVNADLPTQPPATTMPAGATIRPASQPGVPLRERLASILNRLDDTGAFCAARVVDPATGEELFSQFADRPVTPASNMKVAVAAAALEFFGAEKVFETDLYIRGNELHLIGCGDPALGDVMIAKQNGLDPLAFMNRWADELKAMGKTRISRLTCYDRSIETRHVHPDWDDDDLVEWYAAPVGGLNLNDNCIDVTVTPGATSQPATLDVFPKTNRTIRLVNETTTGDKADVDITRATTANVFTVKGTVAEKATLQSKPVVDPSAFFADALCTRLAERGITIDDVAMSDYRPLLAGHDLASQPVKLTPATSRLTQTLARLLKASQNLFAEGIAKQLGAAYAADVEGKRGSFTEEAEAGSWSNGERAIRAFLKANDIDDTHYVFADGSGLSSKNKVTARLVSDVYLAMMRKPTFEVWKDSQTIAGVDGTTRNRLKDKPGRVFCKTGYISHVRSLSGYVVTESGRTLVFSFIYNGIPQRGSAATKPYELLQDEALRLLMEQ